MTHAEPAGTCPIELSCTYPNPGGPRMTIETTDPAPTPPEVLREQVATVLASHEPHYHTETESFTCSPDGTDPAAQAGCLWRSDPDLTDEETARAFRLHVADAALAVFRGQQDPAVQRVCTCGAEPYATWHKSNCGLTR